MSELGDWFRGVAIITAVFLMCVAVWGVLLHVVAAAFG